VVIAVPHLDVTIAELKRLFLTEYNRLVDAAEPFEHCRLVLRGQELSDSATLATSGVQAGGHIHAIIALPAPDTSVARQWVEDGVNRAATVSRQLERIPSFFFHREPASAPEAVHAPSHRILRLRDEDTTGSDESANLAEAGQAATFAMTALSRPGLLGFGVFLGCVLGIVSPVVHFCGRDIHDAVKFGCWCGMVLQVVYAMILPAPVSVAIKSLY
jgi:hypothetical protein